MAVVQVCLANRVTVDTTDLGRRGEVQLRFIRNEKGVITAYFGVLLPVFLLFAALGLDYGRAFVLKHQLQSACDAASLAGASAAYNKFTTDPLGNTTGERLMLDPITAEARATDTWNQNVLSLKFAEKGVTIVDISNHMAIDSDSDGYVDAYRWGVKAKIQSFIAGPVTGSSNEIPVTAVAESKIREP